MATCANANGIPDSFKEARLRALPKGRPLWPRTDRTVVFPKVIIPRHEC